ncbi:hypothetical protein [Thiomicrorhabdus indica]|uniref:PKD domain-containing protein n=1 Tax=Thiomicrorhabdus indica TaxID=2267253 RepID=UPI002AA8CE66|nr:hypothetical protein [Thiomicrorhabdus indica]
MTIDFIPFRWTSRVLIHLMFSFFLLLLPLSAYSDELGVFLMQQIKSKPNQKPSDAVMLLITRDLAWYEANMKTLPQALQDEIQALRIRTVGESARLAAENMNEDAGKFLASGSCKPGRDVDLLYVGTDIKKAKKSIDSAIVSTTREYLAKGADDPILKAAVGKGFTIPKSLDSKAMDVVTSDLPDFGYLDMNNAITKARQAAKAGDANAIKTLKDDLIKSLQKNLDAQVGSMAEDMYRGAAGQRFFALNYLGNPEKVRRIVQDESGQWLLKPGGKEALSGLLKEQVEALMPNSRRAKFAKVASDYSMYFKHGADEAGIGGTAKYVDRIWTDVDEIALLTYMGEDETLAMTAARAISENPKNASVTLANMNLSEDQVVNGVKRAMGQTVENQLLLDVNKLLTELEQVGAAKTAGKISDIEELARKQLIKFDINDLANGLSAMSEVPGTDIDKILKTLHKEFGKRGDMGEQVLGYIEKQLKLFTGESANLINLRILKTLLVKQEIAADEYFELKRKIQLGEALPDGMPTAKLKQARQEILFLTSVDMLELGGGENTLDEVVEQWRSQRRNALITTVPDEIRQTVKELKTMPADDLKKLGWLDVEIKLPMETKLKLKLIPDQMTAVAAKLQNRLGKQAVSLMQWQRQTRQYIFSLTPTQLGEPGDLGPMDAVFSVANGLYQTYSILNSDKPMPSDEENLALANAWVTALPIVGDFADGILAGIEAGFTGNKRKALEAGLYTTIGVMAVVPGGQIPAMITGMIMAGAPIAEGVYEAKQAQNLIQAWIASGNWEGGGDQPMKLVGLFDRSHVYHELTYEDLLTSKGDVPYESEKADGVFSTPTINGSIREYAEKYVFPQYPRIKELRESLKQLFPRFNDREWEDEFDAKLKVETQGGKAALFFFKEYHQIRTQALNQTIKQLKQWTEEEFKVAHDYKGEVEKIKQSLRALQTELKVTNLVAHADSSANAYSKVIKNKMEQETLPLSRYRIYKHYLNEYQKIAVLTRRINSYLDEVPEGFRPTKWFLTGYPEFDRPRITKLEAMIKNGRAHAVSEVERLIKEFGFKAKGGYDPKNHCHKEALAILLGHRYKVAFIENLVDYYTTLAESDSAWNDAYDAAKARYTQVRDQYANVPDLREDEVAQNAMANAVITFVAAMPYALASDERDFYRNTATDFKIKMKKAMRDYEYAAFLTGEAGKTLENCLKSDLKIEISLSPLNPPKGKTTHAKATLKAGTPPAEYYWIWKSEGDVTLVSRLGGEIEAQVDGPGSLTAIMLDDFRNTAKVLGESTMKIVPSEAEAEEEKKEEIPETAQLDVSIKAPTDPIEVGAKANLTVSVGGATGPYRYEWDGVNSRSASATFTASHVGDWSISVSVTDQEGNSAKAIASVRVGPGKFKLKGVEGEVPFGTQAILNAYGMGLKEREIPTELMENRGCDGDADNPFCVSVIENGKVVDVSTRDNWADRIDELERQGKVYVPHPDREFETEIEELEPEEYKVIWQSEPALTFDPVEGPEPVTKITYDRLGEVKIWCELLKMTEGTYQTVGECEQVTVNVKPPELRIGYEPANGQAHVGQKVTATIYSKPSVSNKLIDYRWLDPSTANRLELDGNGRRIVFTVQNTNPVKLNALARVPVHGDELGEVASSYTGMAYGVNAWAVQPPNLPRTWDPKTKGLKTIPRGSRATHERITLQAELVGGEMPDGVRWNWTVNDGTSISNPSSQTPTVTRSSAGTISAQVIAKDAKGHKLGQASVTLDVIEVISPPTSYQEPKLTPQTKTEKNSAAKAMAQKAMDELARGDIKAAEKSVLEAKKHDPETAKPTIAKVVKTARKSGWRAVQQRDFKTARDNLEVADRLSPKHRDTQEKLKKLERFEKVWPRVEAKVPEFEKLVAEKKPFSAQKKMLEIQELQKEMPGGMNNPLSKKVMEAFHQSLREYSDFTLAWENQNREFFIDKNWQAMLDASLEALKRELSPSRKKDIEGSVDLARKMLAEQQKQAEKALKESTDISPEKVKTSDSIDLAKDPSQPKKDIDKLIANPESAPPELRSAVQKAPSNQPQVISKAGYQLKLAKTIYAPNESIKLAFSTPSEIPRNSWVGLIPSHIHHGSEKRNNQHDTSYKMVYNKQTGEMVFKAPGAEGKYDLRMSTPEGNQELISVSFRVEVPKYSSVLLLPKKVFAPNEKIELGFNASPLLPNNTWVGLLPAGIHHGSTKRNNEHDMSYQTLYRKASGKLVFKAPKKEGKYDFRMNETTNDKELASVAFEVKVPKVGNELSLPKDVFAPNEKIPLEFKASPLLPNNSWVGLLPANIHHGSTKQNNLHDISYQTLYGKESGQMVFTAPSKEGSYDFRMNETTNDKELTSVAFKVAVPMTGNELTLNKKVYAPNEKIIMDFKASPLLPNNTWIGLLPANIHHGSTKQNNQYDIAYKTVYGKASGRVTFTAPKKEGNYDFRLNETTNDKELVSVPFQVAVPMNDNQLTLNKKSYAPGEKIILTFKASPLLPNNTWIGMIPSHIHHGSQALNDKHDITYQTVYGKASGQMTFTTPKKAGKYDFRMSETTNDKEVASVTFIVQ